MAILTPVTELGYKGLHANGRAPVPVGYVSRAENMYLQGTAYVTRPALKSSATDTVKANSRVQNIVQVTELGGEQHTLAMVGGSLYEYDWRDEAWEAVTNSLPNVGIVVAPGARMDSHTYRGRVIFTDSVNAPWYFKPDETASDEKYKALNSANGDPAPLSRGVTVYYDRAFFFGLHAEDANVFEWSRPGDLTDGYDADNNSWQFAQTDTGRVVSLVSLNEKMLVFKDDSISVVYGAVEDAFRTDANREGISETEGVESHRAVVVAPNGDVYYMSLNGPRVLQNGFNRIELALDGEGRDMLSREWAKLDHSKQSEMVSWLDKTLNQIVWLWPLKGESSIRAGLVYSLDNNTWSTIRFPSGTDIVSAGNVEDAGGREMVMLGDDGGRIYLLDPDGEADYGSNSLMSTLRSRAYGGHMVSRRVKLLRGEWLIRVLNEDTAITTIPIADHEMHGPSRSRTHGEGTMRLLRRFLRRGDTVGWEIQASKPIEVISSETRVAAVEGQ